MNEFDDIAPNYRSIIDETLAVQGDDLQQYFSEYKAFYIKEIIEKHFGYKKRVKILDYGCGVGSLAVEIHRLVPFCCIHGFDISEESINHIPDELRKAGNRFTSSTDVLDRDYDIAIVCNVMHHVLPDERKPILDQIRDRLSRKGILVLIEHNMLNPLTRRSVDNCPFDADAHMLSVKEASDLLASSGFHSQLKRYITFFLPRLSMFRVIDKYIGWIPLGAQYMICAKSRR